MKLLLGPPLFFRAVVGYCGITAGNQFHPRGNPSTDNSVPAVLPQGSQAKPRDSRGITAVPITVQLSSPDTVSKHSRRKY